MVAPIILEPFRVPLSDLGKPYRPRVTRMSVNRLRVEKPSMALGVQDSVS